MNQVMSSLKLGSTYESDNGAVKVQKCEHSAARSATCGTWLHAVTRMASGTLSHTVMTWQRGMPCEQNFTVSPGPPGSGAWGPLERLHRGIASVVES